MKQRHNNIMMSTLWGRSAVMAVALTGACTMQAQTLRVYTGQVCTAVGASADEMTYSADGSSVSIAGKTFEVAEIDSIVIDNSTVADNTVDVTYSGTEAHVVVAGNIAPYITATVSGANVSIAQSSDVADEITYTAQGASDNGMLYLSGSYKCTLALNGLTLTSTEGAAVQVANGKRIAVVLTDGTTNTLTDAASGSQKACFIVKGHAEFKGGGTLNITGNAKHGYKSGEYTELKASTGSINILSSAGDGMHIGQYLEMKGGTVTVTNPGDDGVQIEANLEGDENDGQVIFAGGKLTISNATAGGKGLKADSLITVKGGEIDIATTGASVYDSTEKDITGVSAMSTDGDMVVSGGTVTLSSTGKGAKGLKVDGALTVTDGSLTATTTGAYYVYSSSLTSAPKAIRVEGAINIEGGEVTARATGQGVTVSRETKYPEGIETKSTLTISGGTVTSYSSDDAINAGSHITISGGHVYGVGTKNDGIDANGNMYINGGLVYAVCSGSPEVALDANTEGGYKLYLNGGTVIAFGGVESGASQSIAGVRSSSWTSNSNYALYSGSTLLHTFKAPASGGSGLYIYSKDLTSGSSYSLRSGVTVSGGTEYFDGYYWEDATVSGGSSTSLTASTSTSGGGGGGGRPGGRW